MARNALALAGAADAVNDIASCGAMRGELACALLDAVPSPVLVVDAAGAPLLVNAAAQSYLARRDALVLRRGVEAVECRSRAALRAAIALAASGEPGLEPQVVAVVRQGRQRPLPVIVMPLAASNLTAAATTHAAVLSFQVPEQPPALPDDLLSRYIGLTRTEAAIAGRLARGQSLADIAADLGLAVSTVRWHLKKILPKAEVRSQAEFVARILPSLLVRWAGGTDRPQV